MLETTKVLVIYFLTLKNLAKACWTGKNLSQQLRTPVLKILSSQINWL
jgi:hypothetical protein